MGKKILLINDLPGYGKVALSVMFPIGSSKVIVERASLEDVFLAKTEVV